MTEAVSARAGVLRPGENIQREILCGAISELLWKVVGRMVVMMVMMLMVIMTTMMGIMMIMVIMMIMRTMRIG